MNKIRKYTKEALLDAVAKSVSFRGTTKLLGVKCSSSSQSLVKRRLIEYGIDTSHFLGKSANRGNGHVGGTKKKKWNEILVLRDLDEREDAYRLRRALIESGRPYRCEGVGCVVDGIWLGKPVVLQVDHINGNWHDCSPENVRFLCPNCHDQTEGHSNRRGCTSVVSTSEGSRRSAKRAIERKRLSRSIVLDCRPRKLFSQHVCLVCGKPISERSISGKCKMCVGVGLRRKVVRPSYEELKQMMATMSICAVGKKYGVSDNAVRKWMRIYEKYNTVVDVVR